MIRFISEQVARLHAENYGVYGRRTMRALMRRQGWEVGRDQTERLMREAGVRGIRKSKRVFTTKSDPALQRPTDLVNRRFTADGPRIVGWNVAATLKAEILPMQAPDMAAWDAGGDLAG